MGQSAPFILSVDDYPVISKLLGEVFTRHHVVAASTGLQALQLARSRPYDAYVLDYELPDMTGEALAGEIRAFEPNAPIVMFSMREMPRSAAAKPWNAWIDKSDDVEALVRCVDHLIEEQRRRNFSAADAELAAISAHLAAQDASAQVSDMEQRIRRAWRKHTQRDVRLQAFRAYLNGGGTRGSFAQLVKREEEDGGADGLDRPSS
jgi:CheY-like chemotaxis protein